jgi:hypothetical protein
MERDMKEILLTTNARAMELSYGLMAGNILENGKTANNMA